MKRDRIKTLLLAEALICALLALALWLFEGDAFSVTGFPGSAVGQGLSALAASGRFGFALAVEFFELFELFRALGEGLGALDEHGVANVSLSQSQHFLIICY